MKKIFFILGVLVISAVTLAENPSENPQEKTNEACRCIDDVKISMGEIQEAEKKQGNCMVVGYCFFKEEKSDQVIAVQQGCSCFGGKLPSIILFNKKEVPEKIIDDYKDRSDEKDQEKTPLQYVQEKIDNAAVVEKKYLSTKKGLDVGMSVDDVIKIYGDPHEKEVVSEEPVKVLVYKWKVLGKIHEKSLKDDPEKKICPEIEVGFDVSVTFEDGKVKLIHMGYHGV